MEISAAMIKELKEKTGAGIVDCKQVLTETKGDMAKAVEILQKKGLSKAAKKEGRAANEGLVLTKIEGKKALALKVNCETDFVAKTDDFKNFANETLSVIFQKGYAFSPTLPEDIENLRKNAVAKLGENILVSEWKFIEAKGELYNYIHLNKVAVVVDVTAGTVAGAELDQARKNIAMQITAMNPVAVDAASIPASKIEELKKVYTEEAKATGKPEKVIENIIKGKFEKFYSESTLLEQLFILDEDKKVKDVIAPFSSKGFAVNNFIRVAL